MGDNGGPIVLLWLVLRPPVPAPPEWGGCCGCWNPLLPEDARVPALIEADSPEEVFSLVLW